MSSFSPTSLLSKIESENELDNSNLNKNASSQEPNSYGLTETPIFNYNGDAKNEGDYFDGWIWNYLDTDSEYGPFLGKQQILLDPLKDGPYEFFSAMFSSNIPDTIAQSANQYATRRRRTTSEYQLNILFYFET